MATGEEDDSLSQQRDHQGAYIFDPLRQEGSINKTERPSKRRRTSKKVGSTPRKGRRTGRGDGDGDGEGRDGGHGAGEKSLFVPLLEGREPPECVQLREKMFREGWERIEFKVQRLLREANSATLDEVSTFVLGDDNQLDKIPSAFIISGTNIASQDLLFEQLAEELEARSRSRFVRLRSSEATNVKAALRKVIQDAVARDSLDEDEGDEVSVGHGGRKYLNYDLEGLYSFVKSQSCEHVFVAFQDSEGFDSVLLSDLIGLFQSWRPRIPFTLLFGLATSVELLQARLLKSTCRLLHGAQFDVVQTDTILQHIFKPAVASVDVVLRLGPPLLQNMVDRQHDQVAGIHTFLSSLKYAYMCHFYANPLSVFAAEDDGMNSELLRPEHLEAFRSLPSFRNCVEEAVGNGCFDFARSALEDDGFVQERIFDIPEQRRTWTKQALRVASLVKATGVAQESFSQIYVQCLSEGLTLSPETSEILHGVKRMPSDEFQALLLRLLDAINTGDSQLGLGDWVADDAPGASTLVARIRQALSETKALLTQAHDKGNTLRSSYTGQSRILRTTIVAQKVQLSHDSATLSEEDKSFTAVVDGVVEALAETLRCEPAANIMFSEAWLYEAKTPYRDVFIPRPRAVFERSLTRPHDYLACSCCSLTASEEGGIATTLPATSLIYHLYLEAGNLVNVADLWSAYFAMVSGGGGVQADEAEGKKRRAQQQRVRATELDERTALVTFYQGLAELKALGFVKHSKKKLDHVAKLKWL